MQRALMQGMEIEDNIFYGHYRVHGSKGNSYLANYRDCDCLDYKRRNMPCKHMYLLAMKLAEFDLLPYIIRSNVKAHPMRGFMNMGTYKVRGRNPKTHRINTKTVYAVDEAGALKAAEPFGLCEPLSVEEVPFLFAHPASIDALTSFGIYVPDGVKNPDIDALFHRYNNSDEATIYRSEWEYAASVGVMLSGLDGVTAAKAAFHEKNKKWLNHEQLEEKTQA